MKKKILVFASGNGSNFQAIIEHFKKNKIKTAEFELLTDKDCYALKRAKKLKIKSHVVPFSKTYEFLSKNHYDLCVLAGYMRILPKEVLDLSLFINIHPSLLPKYKGINSIKKAFEAGEAETGVTIHYVVPEVDSGKIIVQTKINIEGMNLNEVENSIHKIEHLSYPSVVEKIVDKLITDTKINVLVVGSGAREHAIADKISRSPYLNKLYLADANDGFCSLGEKIIYKDYKDLARKAKKLKVELAVIGPELPLSLGIVNVFKKYGIKTIGADKKWTRLESSKSFAKEFMDKHSIPTAHYYVIKNKKKIDEVISKFVTPPVIKADGLAAGKGVYLPNSFEDAKTILTEFLNGKFKKASSKVVVEERLIGEEISVIALYDGKTLLPFVSARDYKRLMDNNLGPNTGGMGAYCPVQLTKEQDVQLNYYLKKLETALNKEHADFTGIIYSGLILTDDGIKVLEYNMRFGDPETQALLMHLKADLLELFIKTANKELNGTKLEFNEGESVCVVVASLGYPDNPKKGALIKNTEEVSKKYGTKIFYAGVKKHNNELLSSGGRVLSVCKTGKNIKEDIYKTIDEIDFCDKIFRTDIMKNK